MQGDVKHLPAHLRRGQVAAAKAGDDGGVDDQIEGEAHVGQPVGAQEGFDPHGEDGHQYHRNDDQDDQVEGDIVIKAQA